MKTTNISDEAVAEKTGKTWSEWFSILDTAEAQIMRHKEIVALFNHDHAIDPWWQQSVTVAYENARGLREKHEMVDGFQISKNITISASAEQAYQAWANEMDRVKWLDDANITIRKATYPTNPYASRGLMGKQALRSIFIPRKTGCKYL